jgi:uncharacterized Zn-binding protein involved in type VI secretion
MDERIFLYKFGSPIPDWDLKHKLSIEKPVAPECKDTGTIYRINSTFMDVTDQPYMYRQILAGGVLAAFLLLAALSWSALFVITHPRVQISGGVIFMWLFLFISTIGFFYIILRIGRDEFFSVKRRPIRFNRTEQKIYTIRRRRFFAKPGAGDITLEVPWNSESIFCMHRSDKSTDKAYHIRCYTVDAQGNVVRAFAIGRQWEGRGNVQGLLSQWNYWCEYMNQGPANLPKPALFLSEYEDVRETFLICVYEWGFQLSNVIRSILLPFILLSTSFRLLSLWTCRDPIWPATVEAVSKIEPDDPFDQPRGDTPVGWAMTGVARERNEWPFDPKREVADWHGEPDPAKNALLWTEDIPPGTDEGADMKDEKGRGVIRLGDKTSHGGEVVSGSTTYKVLGKAVAVEGDMASCPKCKGMFAIKPVDSTRKHHGKQVAYDGDKTECGAKLISSL